VVELGADLSNRFPFRIRYADLFGRRRSHRQDSQDGSREHT
jgi:hypothetical protein